MGQVKILFNLGENAWGGFSTETLWATESEQGFFILDNYPFFMKGVCYGDVVEAKKLSEGLYEYVKTRKRTGNSLYRVLVKKENSGLANQLLKRLENLGCAYETGEINEDILVAVHMPQEVDANLAWGILEEGSNINIWEVQEGDDRHPQ